MTQKGKALLVGLCSVDPASYHGWDGVAGCWGCENDVDSVEGILAPLDYDIDILKTAAAKKEDILDKLNEAATELKNGDIFVYYFSGHGGQQLDENGDEEDNHDETQCAYNGELIDDQLNEVWLKFKAGVRIVMISDSCNSGTVYRNKPGYAAKRRDRPTPIVPIPDLEVSSGMKAKLIHLGGCRDGFGSSGFTDGGAFTIALCQAWDEGKFTGNYKDFHDAICAKISTSQQPQYAQYGSDIEAFRNQKPFTISTVIPIAPLPEYELVVPQWLLIWLQQWLASHRAGGFFNPATQSAGQGENVVLRIKNR
jgi:hypothetical protein